MVTICKLMVTVCCCLLIVLVRTSNRQAQFTPSNYYYILDTDNQAYWLLMTNSLIQLDMLTGSFGYSLLTHGDSQRIYIFWDKKCPTCLLVYTICSLVYTYSFSSIFYLYFYLFGIFMHSFCIFICIYALFVLFLSSFWYLYALSSWCYIMFSSLYSEKALKTSKNFSQKGVDKYIKLWYY